MAIGQFFVQKPKESGQDEDLETKTVRAEAMLCQLIVDSNMSLASADRLVNTMKDMFPDSAIAQSKWFSPFRLINSIFN